MKITKAIQQTAEAWYVRIQSPSVTETELDEFFLWLESSDLNQTAYLQVEKNCLATELLASHQIRADSSVPIARISWLAAFSLMSTAIASGLLYILFFHVGTTYQNQLETAVGEYLVQELPDGTNLAVNSNSLIRLDFNTRRRNLTLVRGEIFLDVAHDESAPLNVITEHGIVNVIGTAFNVQLSDNDMEVVVARGQVGVSLVDGELSNQPLVVLNKNERITVQSASKGMKPVLVDVDEVTAWTTSQLKFSNATLKDVIDEVNRYSDTPVLLDKSVNSDIKITTVFQLSDIKSIPEAIAAAYSLEVRRREGDNILLYKAE